MPGTAHGEAEAILADRGAGVDGHPVADKGMGQRGIGADIAIAADIDPVADDAARGDGGAASDRGLSSDYCASLDRDVLFQARTPMDALRWPAGAVLRRLGLQRVWIEQSERLGEAPIGLGRHQGGGAGRRLARELGSYEAGRGAGMGEERQIFRVVEKREIPPSRRIQRPHILDFRLEVDLAG